MRWGESRVLRESPVELLLVENNPADVRLVVEGLRQSVTPTHLSVVRDGQEVLAYLRREGMHATAPRPHLIILDLDLPGKNGLEVLGEIKADDSLRVIPVVVLTGSREPEDIVRSYQLHANAYVTKPIHLNAFLSTVGSILSFWLEIATPPPSL
jgi:chemotaxis family two-component system response regulator Rcp1